ncbi:MAG: glucosamine-6-phosphate deaminase [Isosphaeraceae bacterium]
MPDGNPVMSLLAQPPSPIVEFSVEKLKALVFEDRAAARRAATAEVAKTIVKRLEAARHVNIVFAAAPSQNEFLAGLVASNDLDWSRVHGFHMDEYLGLGEDHPASFRRYLIEHLFGIVGIAEERRHLIPGENASRPLKTCLDYEEILRDNPTDIVCAGIGENGHLAFNDPPVADFLDPVLVKVVRLDRACREQQVFDGCFAEPEEVPTHAYTLTVPALLSAPVVSVIVPGPRKAEAVLATLKGPYGETCPASALRRHVGARLYLDRESARLVL